jgi:hypothetical protein
VRFIVHPLPLNRLEEYLSLAPTFPLITSLWFSGEGSLAQEFVQLMKRLAQDLNGIAPAKRTDSFAMQSTNI